MQLHDMEEQLKNLDARTTAIEQILPTLATKDDLRLTTAALQHEIETGFQEANDDAERLDKQIRLLAHQTKGDFQELRGDMRELRGDVQELRGDMQELRGEMQELRGEMTVIGGDVRVIAQQVAILSARKRKKH